MYIPQADDSKDDDTTGKLLEQLEVDRRRLKGTSPENSKYSNIKLMLKAKNLPQYNTDIFRAGRSVKCFASKQQLFKAEKVSIVALS